MILGIDLGTSNSMAAVYVEGKPVIIESRFGRKQIPSVVSTDKDGNFFAGDLAKEMRFTCPERAVSAFKREMGTENVFQIGEKKMKAVELSAVVLRNIREDAERFLHTKITDAVISVPAFFLNPQRKAVIQAGELAGLNVRQIINEPTAAAMAYGINDTEYDIETGTPKIIMVMDLGGGTFDISIVEQSGDIMEVVAVCGDNHLGGEDFTKRLMDMFKKKHGIEGELQQTEESALWKQAERAKAMFAVSGSAHMKCSIGGTIYDFDISEQEYETACFDLLERMRKLALRAVMESRYDMEDISEILMVGGGLKLSIIKKMIDRISGRTLSYQIDPDEAVAVGAALTGYIAEQNYEAKDLIMTDICPYNMGYTLFLNDGYDIFGEFDVLMERNTAIPAKRVHESVVKSDSDGKKVYFTIFQTNGNYFDGASELGEMIVQIPASSSGKIHLKITTIYDVNGIAKVEVYIRENKYKKEMMICNEDCELTMEEAKERMEELQYLRETSPEEEESRLLQQRAERMYAECLGKDREMIGDSLELYEKAVDSKSKSQIAAAGNKLRMLLDDLEANLF